MSVSRACGSLAMNLSREMRSLQAALITFASSYTLTLKISRLLVRRAKLGFASQGQVLTLEALARHQVPSVASSAVTLAAKRTQGVHGPQCASVKGLSPVMRRTVGADVLSITEGYIRGTNGHGPREPTGVEDRSTCTRQSRELGRSSGLLHGRG